MNHEFEKNIKCPYCDWEDGDSWEFSEDSGTATCDRCEREFNVSREVEVTYSTSKIDCEVQGVNHDYKTESYFASKRRFQDNEWVDLPEHEWAYYRVNLCSKCEKTDYIKITKEEYEINIHGGVK